jgi:hypothetical protein
MCLLFNGHFVMDLYILEADTIGGTALLRLFVTPELPSGV